MSAQPKITCSCGRHIEGREILEQGYFMNQWKPVWVYLKYRCSRCRMLGEKLVEYTHWDESVLGFEAGEPSGVEAAGPPQRGAIDEAEVEEFTHKITTMRRSDLDRLAQSLM